MWGVCEDLNKLPNHIYGIYQQITLLRKLHLFNVIQAISDILEGLSSGSMANVTLKARRAAADKWVSLEHVRKVSGTL